MMRTYEAVPEASEQEEDLESTIEVVTKEDAVDTKDVVKDTSAGSDAPKVLATHSSCSIQFWICALSALSGFLFGYDLCVMVIALPLIQEDFDLSTAYAESIVSVLMVGAVFGSFSGGILADWFGRKKAILVTASFFLTGSIFMTFATAMSTMLIGRFLAGLAVGSSGPCSSAYIAEVASPEHRGALVALNDLMVCIGCLISIITSGLLQNIPYGWRYMLSVTIIPPVLQLLGVPFLPESPRWLLSQSKEQEAKDAVRLLFQEDADPDQRLKSFRIHKGLHCSLWHSLLDIVRDVSLRPRLFMCIAIGIAQSATGANAMLYYSSYILDALDPDRIATEEMTKEVGVAIAKLLGVSCAMFAVDRFGRRSLLLLGSIVMYSCHLSFAFSFSMQESETAQDVGMWTLYVFIFAWNLSWAPLMYVICAELLPDEHRSLGMGIAFASFWLSSAVVNQTLLTLFYALGTSNAFLFYALLTAISLTFVYLKVPETKGLTLEQIDQVFSK